MVSITGTDGETTVYETFEDEDEPAGVVEVKHVKETILGGEEDIEQKIRLNLAHLTMDDIKQRFGEEVVVALEDE